MQATKTNPGIPGIPVSPATTTGRSKKQTNPTKVVQGAYNIQYFVELNRITVHGNVYPPPYRCTNPVSVTCQLTQAKSPTKPRFCALRFPIPFPLLVSSLIRWNPDRCLVHPPLSHSGSRYMHPTHHIAVKLASDTLLLLFESAHAHLELC